MRALVSPKPIREATVKAYLFTIARNLYLQQLRKKAPEPLDETLASSARGPDAGAEQKDELAKVLAAMQQLPEVDRAALLMRASSY